MAGQRELHDHFFKEAKRNGFRSRAAYKLSEIDDKRKIFSKGDAVLDLGAAPGSWLQVASKRVGKKGVVIGVDLQGIDAFDDTQIHTLVCDVNELTSDMLHKASGVSEFDVIMSDMAPKTTGNRTIDHHGSMHLCHRAIDLSAALLKPDGHLVMKLLEGEAYPELLSRAGECFEIAKGFKPKASRAISTELFLVCKHRKEHIPVPEQVAPSPPTGGW